MSSEQYNLHEVLKDVTEHQKGYIQVSLIYVACLFGCDDISKNYYEQKLAFFYSVFTNMHYPAKDKSKYYNKRHDKKIVHAQKPLTVKGFLRLIHPGRYSGDDDPKLNSDRSNFCRKMNKYFPLNQFHVWIYKGHYMPIMERDICVWKNYNENAYVVPASIVKTLRNHDFMLDDMAKVAGGRDKDLEDSFALFVGKMIEKMNPSLISKFPSYDEFEDISSYVSKIVEIASKMEACEGTGVSKEILYKVPEIALNRYNKDNCRDFDAVEKYMEEEGMDDKDTNKKEFSDKDIIPKDQNLVKPKKSSGTKKVVKESSSLKSNKSKRIKPEKRSYSGDLDPFKDCNNFMRYYRAKIESNFPCDVNFEDFDIERETAQEILDRLIERERDKVFLDYWIDYYCHKKIRNKENAKKKYKTSLDSFLKTMDSYESIYIGAN